MPGVIKRDGSRQPFDEEKLQGGMLRAVEKRPVSMDEIEQALSKIKSTYAPLASREVPSEMVGNLMMEQLMSLDKVAYHSFCFCVPRLWRCLNLVKYR